MITCSHCGVRVAVSADGHCPSCRRSVADDGNRQNPFADNSNESPHETVIVKTIVEGMTTGEKFYSATVIICVGIFLASLALFHFVLIPGSDDPGVFYFIASIMWMYVLTLTATTVANLSYRSLLTIPTIIQCAVLGFAVYFIPLAIWGGVLLYRRLHRAKNAG